MSFLRRREIFRSDESGRPKLGRCSRATPPAHRLDESPTGDPLAGCAPAEPTSISPVTASMKEPAGQDNNFSANGNLSRFSLSQHGGPYQTVTEKGGFQGRFRLAWQNPRWMVDTARIRLELSLTGAAAPASRLRSATGGPGAPC